MSLEFLPYLTSLIVALGSAFYLTKRWIPAARYFGLVGKDMNKYAQPEVAEGGGISVVIGITLGLFSYLFLKAFIITPTHLVEIYSVISVILLAGLLGFADDILGWKKGIRQRRKVLLSAAIALPMMTLTLLHPEYNTFSSWGIPLWFYALIMVPIGIIGASNAVNMVAGYNGLEAGLGAIILATLAIQAYILQEMWVAYMAIIGVAALLGFLYFNWYPAKVFPGDSLSYSLGAYIGALVILGNIEIFGVLLFPLFFLDFILYFKARKIDNMGDVQAFGVPDENGHLELPYEKIYDSCHLAIKIQKKLMGYATERGVVIILLSIQALISLIVLLLYNLLSLPF